MIRSVELELHTVSEANAREFWRVSAGRHAHQRDVVRRALNEQFGAPPLFSVMVNHWTKPNPIEITLTRLAPGELDPDENLPVSMKYVKDEIAAWFGVDDRDKRLRWRYQQERTAAGIYKIRIEIADATAGDDIRVQLASEPEAKGSRRRPLVRVKRGTPAPPGQASLVMMKCFAAVPWEQPTCGACVWCRCASCGNVALLEDTENDRALLECKACQQRVAVHPAAPPPGTPTCARCGGTGRGKGRRLRPLARYEGLDAPPPWIEWRVPAEQLERYPGATVKLYRRRYKTPTTGLCWLYEERTV